MVSFAKSGALLLSSKRWRVAAAIFLVFALTVAGGVGVLQLHQTALDHVAKVRDANTAPLYAVLASVDRAQRALAELERNPDAGEELEAAMARVLDQASELSAGGLAAESPEDATYIARRLQALGSLTSLARTQGEEMAETYRVQATDLSTDIHAAVADLLADRTEDRALGLEDVLDSARTSTMLLLGLILYFGVVSSGLALMHGRDLRQQERRREAEERAAFLANYDSLTGLTNRAGFQAAAEKQLADRGKPATILLDINDFRQINDLFGHATGDMVLCEVARAISATVVPAGGVCARLGGDEFAVVLPGPVSSMRAAALCAQINTELADSATLHDKDLHVTVNAGIALAGSVGVEDEISLPDMMRASELALAHAGLGPQPGHAFFDAELAAVEAERKRLEANIDAALDAGEFELAYQPQVNMATGVITGFEALSRWNRDGEMVSPGVFIPVAEETGQVVEIDIQGLRLATMQSAEWIRSGAVPVTLSTNLSPLHFRTARIVDEVKSALENSGLPPHLLTLEITESVLIDDLNSVTVILDQLRALGVRLALDDFGTGYSSLAYLRKLDVDYIKIDQSFVRDLDATGETRVILQALVDIARGLGKSLVVEGIETEEQAQIIRDLGCDLGQGYLFGRPLPLVDARALLANRPDLPDRAKETG